MTKSDMAEFAREFAKYVSGRVYRAELVDLLTGFADECDRETHIPIYTLDIISKPSTKTIVVRCKGRIVGDFDGRNWCQDELIPAPIRETAEKLFSQKFG